MTGVGMIIILLSDQDLILGLSLPVVGRSTGGPLIPGRMAGVLMTGRIRHPADLKALGVIIAVLQDLVLGHTGMNSQIVFIEFLSYQVSVNSNMIFNDPVEDFEAVRILEI